MNSESAPVESYADKTLGDFHLLRRLGRGGMAEVYLAEQMSLKRKVAVKVLRRDLLADQMHLERFRREALASASLIHPNIIQVILVGESEGTQFIAQEYVPGMNLREFLSRKGPPETALAVHIMKQVLSALQVAGSAGIVHRDIKPENIMITRRGDVKVADFGLAQLNNEGQLLSLTQTGMTMGTPLYMSPEQVSGQKLDSRSDLYSFGITCYHMLTGTAPFKGETAVIVAMKHLNEEPTPIEELRPDLPPALCQFVRTMMAKLPENRFANAQAALKELKRVLHDAGVSAPPSTAPAAASSPAPLAAKSTGSPLAVTVPSPSTRPSRSESALWRWVDRPWQEQALTFFLIMLVLTAIGAGVGWALRPPNPLATPTSSTGASQSSAIPADQLDSTSAAVAAKGQRQTRLS